jgi:hypothetical protein
VSEDTIESNYQFLKVTRRSRGDGVGGSEGLVQLTLDHLIHGYVALKMPEPGEPWDSRKAVFDPSYLKYDYEKVYAIATARCLRGSFKFDDGAAGPAKPAGGDANPKPIPPTLLSLFLGGGTFTFQRYLNENYPGEDYIAKEGDSLRKLVIDRYSPRNPADADDFVRRVALYNEKTVKGGPKLLSALDSGRETLTAGTKVRFPSIADVAELDPMVTEINHTRLKLARYEDDPRIKTWAYDARNFVEAAVAAGWSGKYDVIYGDAFNHYSVPYHLTTKEFNDNVKKLLKPDGSYIALIIDKYNDCRFLSAEVTTFRQTFKHVYVFAARDRRDRNSGRRETFVLVGSDTPRNFAFLGGASDEVRERLKARDERGVREALGLPDDRGFRALMHGAQELFASLPSEGAAKPREGDDSLDLAFLKSFDKEGPAAAIAELDRLQAIDRFALMKENAGTGATAFDTVCLTERQRDREIVDRGRPPAMRAAFRNSPLVRMWLGRVPAEFAVDAEAMRRARDLRDVGESDLPWPVRAKLRPLAGKRFATVEEFSAALASKETGLTREELHRQKPLLIRACRVPDVGRGEPLVLTDDHTPVEDLLAVLFDEN